jgi:hypothetical protein
MRSQPGSISFLETCATQSCLDTPRRLQGRHGPGGIRRADRRTPGLSQGIQASLVDHRGGHVQLIVPLGHEASFSTAFSATMTSASRQTLVLTVMERVKRKENISVTSYKL